MSASELEFSEGSNAGSPLSQAESPYSSPSQQVPYLASAFSGITCTDDISMHNSGRPYLKLIEQPQDHFRFRYKSEMVGTHGCLLGKSTSSSKPKTHPTVELLNYSGKALIRCRLSQTDKDEEHPHKLLEDEQEDRDVSAVVPEHGSYKVGFAGMGIIHTAKKDVPGLLFKKYMDKFKNVNTKELRTHCENTAKTINLNIVRLRFSAHDIVTDKEICPPVFSEPIHNMKSAATNDLKICRISRYFGRPRGGDDVFILVEKVNKKNIIIRFYELNENDEEVWTANGNFLQSDVHHQYAIVFRTPAYKDPQINKDVKVYIELVRPQDGRTSEPKEFIYKADPAFKSNKKRRVHSSYSSLESSSGSSIKSLSEVPAIVEMINNNERGDGIPDVPMYQIHIPQVPTVRPTSNNDLVADALFYNTTSGGAGQGVALSPMLGQPNIPEPPVIQLNSSELERLINHDPHIPSEERRRFLENDWTEYMRSFGESLPEKTSFQSSGMEFIRSSMNLVADSGRAKIEVKEEPLSPSHSATSSNEERKPNIVDKSKGSEYQAFYKAEDGVEVKKLVKEICEIIKHKTKIKKNVVRSKLERLCEMRLSNGDTFLHMTLSSNPSSFEFIIKLIHSMRMTHLLNLANDHHQTILHLAVINDMPPKDIAHLVSKGCDPMQGDKEGNNAIHYAVICQTSLTALLHAISTNNIQCDLNAYNNEKQTALHLAAIYNSKWSTRCLLEHKASHNARDSEGRTPLHLAAYDNYLAVASVLLDFIPPTDIDALDGRGNTALQIVCGGGVKQNTLEFVKLLLDKGADPLKHEEHNQSAWKMASGNSQLRELMRAHVPAQLLEDEIKSEPEDDFESADEGDTIGLHDLSLFISEVSALLDATGAWQPLARRLRMDSLLSWYANTHSPTRTLLNHLKIRRAPDMCTKICAQRDAAIRKSERDETGENVTSKSLAMLLQDMGQVDAATVIRRYLSD